MVDFAVPVYHRVKIKESKKKKKRDNYQGFSTELKKNMGHEGNNCQCCDRNNLLMIIKGTGGAHGVMVIVVGNGHGDTSSDPGRGWLHFT